jgi:hypothetical protein
MTRIKFTLPINFVLASMLLSACANKNIEDLSNVNVIVEPLIYEDDGYKAHSLPVTKATIEHKSDFVVIESREEHVAWIPSGVSISKARVSESMPQTDTDKPQAPDIEINAETELSKAASTEVWPLFCDIDDVPTKACGEVKMCITNDEYVPCIDAEKYSCSSSSKMGEFCLNRQV